ncbi:hypothetical protein [Kibdelosporangium aridum]|uniref:hypothetical protein n=1 Tax=Kibdelosporangium aridum TaxID=2030 RepID=UPI0035EC315F
MLDEYLKASVDPTGGTQRNKQLSHGWSCATDGGSGASAQGIIACTTGKPDGHGGVIGGFAFHTERVR